MNRLTALLTGAWLGMQIMAAYAAGILFERIGRQDAGDIAGVLFATVNYCGLAVWLLAWFATKNRRAHGFGRAERSIAPKFNLLLLALLAANQFLIAPVIAAHKAGTGNWLLSLAGGSFGIWHGTSSLIYLACGLIGAGLLLRYLSFNR
ncbi:TPA: DUF4149 domain-containing protein [Neisseria bacilliformis]|uniref:TMEM205-like domain-containing protein n=1 Tax=Neisseria bacilliformis ATCC BAA-1200 TaxID=888742 RepID=F2BB19_9NEIS|nr:DUF4149 domain-containing protein [Neisseria bacilliformis]EGF11373.1 hypothetical protein HMPREF9123_0923 [Neisseria bacilliformis ATCC BAA-1200]QMT48057.1 DUF4149 domain-containing protein [Neisseria bacilliformis]